jgi:hypothetical protein
MAPAAAKSGDNAQDKESPVVIVRVRPFLPRELQYDNAVELVSVGALLRRVCAGYWQSGSSFAS